MTSAFQTAMARIYTEPALRQALYRGDASALAAGSLSAGELDLICRFAHENRERLELYTSLLATKKRTRSRERWPILAAALDAAAAPGWNSTWQAYQTQFTQERRDASIDPSPGLFAFVESANPAGGEGAALVREALRYERAKWQLSMTVPPEPSRLRANAGCPRVIRPFVLLDFEYDLLELRHAERVAFRPPARGVTRILFFREPRGSVGTARISWALAALLCACDGRKSEAELGTCLRANGITRASESAVAQAVAHWTRAGLLVNAGASLA